MFDYYFHFITWCHYFHSLLTYANIFIDHYYATSGRLRYAALRRWRCISDDAIRAAFFASRIVSRHGAPPRHRYWLIPEFLPSSRFSLNYSRSILSLIAVFHHFHNLLLTFIFHWLLLSHWLIHCHFIITLSLHCFHYITDISLLHRLAIDRVISDYDTFHIDYIFISDWYFIHSIWLSYYILLIILLIFSITFLLIFHYYVISHLPFHSLSFFLISLLIFSYFSAYIFILIFIVRHWLPLFSYISLLLSDTIYHWHYFIFNKIIYYIVIFSHYMFLITIIILIFVIMAYHFYFIDYWYIDDAIDINSHWFIFIFAPFLFDFDWFRLITLYYFRFIHLPGFSALISADYATCFQIFSI